MEEISHALGPTLRTDCVNRLKDETKHEEPRAEVAAFEALILSRILAASSLEDSSVESTNADLHRIIIDLEALAKVKRQQVHEVSCSSSTVTYLLC